MLDSLQFSLSCHFNHFVSVERKLDQYFTLDETEPELTGEVEVVAAAITNGDVVEEEEKMNEQEEDEEEILTLGDSNPEEAIAPSEGLNIGLDAEEDTDPGYEIVTEDRGTNCPSLSGSLRKMPRLKPLGKAGTATISMSVSDCRQLNTVLESPSVQFALSKKR